MPEQNHPFTQGQTIAGVQVDYEKWPETNGLAPIAGAESQGGPPAPPPPAQATPPADPAQGESEPGGTGEGGFNWGFFPDVPEDQREALEPHLTNVQGHVTQMEQQMAALRPLIDQGVGPEQLMPLVQFDAALQQSPIETFMRLARNMAESDDPRVSGAFGNLDWDSVEQILQGQDPGEGEPGGEGLPEGQESNPLMPVVQQLQAQVQQLEQSVTQDQTQRRQSQEDAMLQGSLNTMRSQLGEAGVPVPEEGTDPTQAEQFEKVLVSSLITNDGDPAKAVQSLLAFRDANLKGFTQSREQTGDSQEPETPKGPPKKSGRSGKSKDSWRTARAGADQYLKRQLKES